MAEISEAVINVRFYKLVQGVRTPYILLLDGRRNLIAEQVDHEQLSRMTARGPLLSVSPATGIVPTPASDGSRWFAPEESNPFPGTEALRAEYFEKVQQMKDSHAARGEACPDCMLGTLLRQYRVTLEEAGHRL